MARSATGVVRRHGSPRLMGFFPTPSNHPPRPCGRGFPSLSKEGSFTTETRLDRQARAAPRRKQQSIKVSSGAESVKA